MTWSCGFARGWNLVIQGADRARPQNCIHPSLLDGGVSGVIARDDAAVRSSRLTRLVPQYQWGWERLGELLGMPDLRGKNCRVGWLAGAD